MAFSYHCNIHHGDAPCRIIDKDGYFSLDSEDFMDFKASHMKTGRYAWDER